MLLNLCFCQWIVLVVNNSNFEAGHAQTSSCLETKVKQRKAIPSYLMKQYAFVVSFGGFHLRCLSPGSHLCRKHLSGGSSPVVGQGVALPAVNKCVCGAAHQHLGEVDDCIRAKHFTQGPILS